MDRFERSDRPDPDGMARALTAALADAALSPDMIGYVNAHRTGPRPTKYRNGRPASQFSTHARQLAISSTKSVVGHTLGAAGALEFVTAIMAIRDGIAPPTMNYLGAALTAISTTSPMKSAHARPRDPEQSFAFGGLNAVLAAPQFAG